MAYSSIIANELLVTPFDDKSAVTMEVSKKLTEEEFCEHCYSHPNFEQKSPQFMQEDFKDEDNDSLTNYNEIINQAHQQKMAYKNFEIWLNNFRNSKVYTINGNAGTGKTTFINYKKYKEKKIKWIILDVHLARSFDEWISDVRTDVSHFEQARSKVYGCIMNMLWEMIFQGLDKDGHYSLQIIEDNLRKIVTNYKNRFANQYPSGRKLLDQIYEAMKIDGDIFTRVETSAELFKKYINGQIGENGRGIIDILNIFLLILRCLSDNDDERYIIVFDNFERFIAKDELYNKDVDEIRLLLTSYIKRINQGGNLHKDYFKFAMAIRDSTARMCGVRLHASDAEASNLDLGGWYHTTDIICLKKKWYKDNQITIKNSDIVEQITGDLRICSDQTVTGLKLLIDPLFNDNKRLIIDFIGSMVELPGNEKNIKKYINLWHEDTSQSRFAARSIIRGMILNELEMKPDKLFEHLKTYSTQNIDNGIGDARKILTILYNASQKENKHEMPLESVLSELFNVKDVNKIWSDKNNSKKIKTLSEILFYMNSYNRRENDWIQFVDLQFRNSNSEIVVEDAEKLEQIIKNHIKDCTIHLMPAGKAYLIYIVASFEFFSLRYVPNYTPLFALIPTPEEIKRYDSVKELPCFKKIESVVQYAEKCIDLLIHKEDTIRIFIGNSINGKYHFIRIIEQHKAYIETFVKFIRDKYCYCSSIDEMTIIKYKILCREIITKKNQYNKYENGMHKNLRR